MLEAVALFPTRLRRTLWYWSWLIPRLTGSRLRPIVPHILPCFICTSPRLGSLLSALICRLFGRLKILISLSASRRRRRSSIASCGRFRWCGVLRANMGPRVSSLISSTLVSICRPNPVGIILGSLLYIEKDLMCRLNPLKFSCDFAFPSRITVGVISKGCWMDISCLIMTRVCMVKAYQAS